MNELIHEIEEDIRRERIEKLWHSFGKVMVGISVLIILATVAIEFFQHKKQSQEMEYTAAFLKGIDRINIEDYKGAIEAFSALENDESSPYYGLYMLRKAQAEAALSKRDEAAKTYTALASHDPVLGRMAALLIPGADDKTPVLAESKSVDPFSYTSSEWKGWRLLEQGKKDEAVLQFLALYNDPAAPGSIHGRMGEVLHHIAPDKLSAETPEIRDISHE